MLRFTLSLKAIILIVTLSLSSVDVFAGKEEVIKITTSKGEIYIWLYKDTPKHRENFLKLAKEGFYDSTTFHRVIKGFMIQGGDPNTKPGNKGVPGEGGPGYTIDAEIIDKYYHRKGAVAAARMGDQVNPERNSSGSQFYIVQGKPVDTVRLRQLEKQLASKIDGFKLSDEQMNTYSKDGGAPWLDMQYSIFGEVIEGYEVIDKIASAEVDGRALPKEVLYMKVEVVKLSKRKLRKQFGFEVPEE